MKILNSADDEEAPTGALPMLSNNSSRGVISTLPAISTLSTSVSASTTTPPVVANTVTDESIQSADTALISSSTESHDNSHVAVAPENLTTTNEIITSIVEGLVTAAAASWSPTVSTESINSSDKVSDEGVIPGTTRSDAVDAHRLQVETTTLESSVAETLSSDVPVTKSIEIDAASSGDISTSESTSTLDAKSTSTDALSSDTPQVLPDIITSFGSSSAQSVSIVVTPPRSATAQSSVDHQAEPPVPSPLPPPPVSSGWAFADPSRVAAKFIPPQSAKSSSSTSSSLNGASPPITQRLIGASVVVISVDSGPISPIAGLIRLVTLVDTKKGGDDETRNDDNSLFEYVIGVELDTPSGSSDGSNNGFLYFECEGNTSVGARPGSSASLPYAVFIPITVQVSGGRVLLFSQPSQPLPPTAGASSLISSSSSSSSATNATTHSDVQSMPNANTTQSVIVPREAQVVRFDETSFASSSSSSSISTSTSHPTRAAIDSESAADAAEPRSVMAYDGIEEDEDENDEAGDQSTNSNQQQQQRSLFLLRNGARSYAAANLARLSSNAPVPPPVPAAPSPSVTAVQAKRPPWNKSVITPWRRVDVKEKLLLSSLDNPVAEGLSMNVMFSSSDKRGPLSPSSSTASQLMSRPSGKMPLLATQPNLAMSQATHQMHPPIPDIDADVDARVVAWLDAIMLPHAAIPIAESIALAKFYASAMMEGTSSQMMDAAADGKVLVVPVNLSDVAALQGPEIAALPGLSVADAVKLGEAVVALRVIVPNGGSAQKIAPDSAKANVSSHTTTLDSEKPTSSNTPSVDASTQQPLPVSLPASSASKAPHQIEDAKRLQSLPPLSPSSFNLPASSSASYKQPQKSMSPDAFVSSSSSPAAAAATSPTTLSPAAADAESRLLPWELEKLSKEREKEKSALAAAASSSVRSLQLQSQMSQQAHGQQHSISSAQREQDSAEDKEGLIAPVTPSSSNSVTVGQIANFATEAALKRAQKALAASRNTSSSTPRMTAGSASSSSASTSGVRPSSSVQPPPLPSLSGNSKINTPSSSTSVSSSTRPIGETVFAAAAAAARQSTSKVSSALKPASPRSSNAAKKASMSPSRHSISASASSPRKERTAAPDIELPGGVVVSASSVIEAGVALTPAQLNALLGDDSKEMQGTDREGEGGSSARESNVSRSSPRTAKEIRASSRHVVPSHIVPPRARSKSSAASTTTSEVSSSENVRPVSSISATSTRNGTSKSDSSSSAAIKTSRKSNTDGGASATGSSPKKQQQQQTPTASRRQSSVDDKRVSFSDADTVASTSSPSRKSSTAALSTTGKSEESGVGNSFRPDLKAATAHVGDPSRGQDRDRLRKLLSGRTLLPRPAVIGASGASSIVSSSSLITEQASPTSLNLPAPRSPPRSVQPRSPEPQLADIQFTDVDAALVAKLKDIHMVPYAPQFGLFGFGTVEKAKALSVEDLNKRLSIPIVDARKIKASL